MFDVEAGAGCLGSSTPDTASDDEALGLVVVDALLLMPPVVAGAGCRRYIAPDAASYDNTLGPVFQDALLRMQYRQWAYCIKRILLGPVYVDALLLIPPVTLEHIV